jgi:hypothetical protein
MNKPLMCVALGIALAVGNTAFAAGPDPRSMLNSFTQENLLAAAAAMQFQASPLQDAEGHKAIAVTALNGIKFIAQPTACQKPNQVDCFGLSIFGLFNDPSGAKPPVEALNYFNGYRSFTKAYSDSDNVYLARYEIADFGIPMGNVMSNFGNFASIGETFVEFINSGGTGVSYTPVPDTHTITNAFGGAGTAPMRLDIEKPNFKLTPEQRGFINTLKH